MDTTIITPEVINAVRGAFQLVAKELQEVEFKLDKQRRIYDEFNTRYAALKKLHTSYKLFLAPYEKLFTHLPPVYCILKKCTVQGAFFVVSTPCFIVKQHIVPVYYFCLHVCLQASQSCLPVYTVSVFFLKNGV